MEEVQSLLMDKLNISSCSVVENLDPEYSGVVSFGIGRSCSLMKVQTLYKSLCNVVSRYEQCLQHFLDSIF